jgi:hypothetical protein
MQPNTNTLSTLGSQVESRLQMEMTRVLYRSAPAGLGFHFVLAVVTTISLWGIFPHRQILCWVSAVFACTAGRFWGQIVFKDQLSDPAASARARGAFIAGALCASTL